MPRPGAQPMETVMSRQTILSIVNASPDRDLAEAIIASRSAKAHLSVLALAVAPGMPVADIASAGTLATVWLETRQAEEQALAKRVEWIEQQIAAADIAGDVNGVCVELGRIAGEVGTRGRYADVVMLGADLREDTGIGSTIVDAALFESGAPILVAPRGSTPSLSPRRIVIAWNSTYESARAARAAVAVLSGVEEIRVAMVDPDASSFGSGDEPGADIAAFLARKGISVTVDRLPGLGLAAEGVLARHASDASADMIVMGAYGHSRLRERLFGGVTRSMLHEPPLPILMAR
jgi:nucleotide-binding universal stress UspA family protein